MLDVGLEKSEIVIMDETETGKCPTSFFFFGVNVEKEEVMGINCDS